MKPSVSKRSVVALFAVACGIAVIGGCTSRPGYPCTNNKVCIAEDGVTQGVCEKTGNCSFPDAACTVSGRRYADGASSSFASACVDTTNGAPNACIKQVTVGIDFVCALKVDGTVWCWGANDQGQLGDNTQNDRAAPAQVPGISNITKVYAAEEHTCALDKDGHVWCWGINDSLNLGQCNGDALPLSTKALEVPSYTLDTSGNPQCQADTPFQAKSLTSGGEHNCAIGLDDKLYCWGENQTGEQGGQSGQDPAKYDDVPGPLEVSGGFDGPVDVQAGDEFTCVLKDENSTWCFGANSLGELGNGKTALNFTAINVAGFSDASALAIDDETGCSVTHDGSLWCWGNGSTGIFSASDLSNRTSPVLVTTVSSAFSGSTSETLCMLQSDTQLQCWGANDKGQTGTGLGDQKVGTPTRAPLITVKAGSGAMGADNGCALTQDGQLFCWGDNSRGQLGPDYPTTGAGQNTPVRVSFPCP